LAIGCNIGALEKEMAPQVVTHLEARPTERGLTVDERSVVYGEERGQDHPHCCWDGYVYLGYTDEDGEEQIEKLPCRLCVEESGASHGR
jgi:hypothetical protein